jgi:hypothetical protein
MLTRLFPFLYPDCLEAELPAKLHRLADDIELLRERGQPSAGDLRAAPFLDQWTAVATLLGLRLTGIVSGHPLLGDRRVVTSALWIADPKAQWVRTLSRYYRLGEPSELEAIQAAMRASTLDGEDSSGDDA